MKHLFLTTRLYMALAACSVVLFSAYFWSWLLLAGALMVVVTVLLALTDGLLLFGRRQEVFTAERLAPQRFSLGDENTVQITARSRYSFPLSIRFIDELPFQFQERNFSLTATLPPGGRQTFSYQLKPLTRGAYLFGRLLAYVKSPLGLLQRRFETAPPQEVKVYPAFLQLKQYELMARTGLAQTGQQKIRKLGQSLEFEKIKDYVHGDDVRHINWKATARQGGLMVNTFTDTRRQQVYCLIDKGRNMKASFNGMTLMDYAINAALAVLHTVLLRNDLGGLITFSHQKVDMVPAGSRKNQEQLLLEALYRQETDFMDPDYAGLYQKLFRTIGERSLLLLFTNFETAGSVERQLPYLKQLARRHLLCVVFFQNDLLADLAARPAESLEDIYVHTMAARFNYDKRQIVRELRRHGILSLMSSPAALSIAVVNKYLELKARHAL